MTYDDFVAELAGIARDLGMGDSFVQNCIEERQVPFLAHYVAERCWEVQFPEDARTAHLREQLRNLRSPGWFIFD